MHKGERFNTITHLAGSIAALIGLIVTTPPSSKALLREYVDGNSGTAFCNDSEHVVPPCPIVSAESQI
jgi:predicted membrane channel-forming protein YqfA (hemolysin III family)